MEGDEETGVFTITADQLRDAIDQASGGRGMPGRDDRSRPRRRLAGGREGEQHGVGRPPAPDIFGDRADRWRKRRCIASPAGIVERLLVRSRAATSVPLLLGPDTGRVSGGREGGRMGPAGAGALGPVSRYTGL